MADLIGRGNQPRWRKDGKKLVYLAGNRMMSVIVTMKNGFTLGAPMALFQKPSLQAGYDISSDGKRFLIFGKPSDEPPLSVHIVHNWFEEFRGGLR